MSAAPPLTLRLRDRNAALVQAWQRHFGARASVEVSQGDIFGAGADALVSPANSFGYMDGGIDAVYLERFGGGLQSRLQRVLAEEHHGELPVGQAVIVATGRPEMPWLVSAPTMRIPRRVDKTLNAYLAFRAALRAVLQHNAQAEAAGAKPIGSILCPGLGTAIGGMPEDRCARQMAFAYAVIIEGQRWPSLSPREIHTNNAELLA